MLPLGMMITQLLTTLSATSVPLKVRTKTILKFNCQVPFCVFNNLSLRVLSVKCGPTIDLLQPCSLFTFHIGNRRDTSFIWPSISILTIVSLNYNGQWLEPGHSLQERPFYHFFNYSHKSEANNNVCSLLFFLR